MQKKLADIEREFIKRYENKEDSVCIDKELCSRIKEIVWRRSAKVAKFRKVKQDLKTMKKFVQKFKKQQEKISIKIRY